MVILVPLMNYTKISAVPILEYIKQNNIKKIVDDIIEEQEMGEEKLYHC